ncbi:hypothetical protein TRIUR3_17560 [Triticum urartu]|uniref:Uncharacterized protein n=1 Tax=Triticum urartu TaxID=4572 RepID=M7YRG4_TRIUA|nr:hypothetical protein TRIUR3_17560 [Triticum urartu]
MDVGQERGSLVPVHVWNLDQRGHMNQDQCPTRPGRPLGLTNRDGCPHGSRCFALLMNFYKNIFRKRKDGWIGGGRKREETHESTLGSSGNPECVVLVLRCDAPAKERNAAIKRLPEISAAARAKGLNLIIALTFKKSVSSVRQAEELLREVSFRARTDCVYFIENYTWSNSGSNLLHPPVIKNDFGTDFTVLTIIRQCLEFIKLNRSQKDKKDPKQADTQADAKTAPKV